jgi:hypothetical protein
MAASPFALNLIRAETQGGTTFSDRQSALQPRTLLSRPKGIVTSIRCTLAAPTAPGSFAPNFAAVDGNGVAPNGPSGAFGVGLLEPNSSGSYEGDDLDALDLSTLDSDLEGPIYSSLDSSFPDPLDPSFNTGSAMANGFVGADVLVSFPDSEPTVYASAKVLGLDVSYWLEVIKCTWHGDANRNGEFNSTDLVIAFQAGDYEQATQVGPREIGTETACLAVPTL